jgi:hypothetical protein
MAWKPAAGATGGNLDFESMRISFPELKYIAPIFGAAFSSFAKRNWEKVSALGLGILGYLNARRIFIFDRAPKVIPMEINFNDHSIKLKNIGKGHAEDVSFMSYSVHFNWFDGRPIVGSIKFENPVVIESGQEQIVRTIAFENGKEIRSGIDILFAWFFPSRNADESKKSPFLVEYRDVGKLRYVTKAIVKRGRFENVTVDRDYYRSLRHAYFSVANVWTRLKVKLQKSKGKNKTPNQVES